MRLDKESTEQIKRVSIGILCCDILLLIIYSCIAGFTPNLVVSVLLGTVVAILGFVWLCLSVQKFVEKAQSGIKTSMTGSYVGRMLLFGAWVVICAKVPFLVPIAGIIPIFFSGISIKVLSLIDAKKKSESDLIKQNEEKAVIDKLEEAEEVKE